MRKDLYKILGIARIADPGEIRAAYRTLAKKYHPDTGVGSSEERFREIQDAYETLGDPARRAAYDRERRQELPRPEPAGRAWHLGWPQPGRHQDPAHIDLSDIFSHLGPEPIGRRGAPHRYSDPWAELEQIFRLFERFDEPDW